MQGTGVVARALADYAQSWEFATREASHIRSSARRESQPRGRGVGSTTARLDADEPFGSRFAARPRSSETRSPVPVVCGARPDERFGYTAEGPNLRLIPAFESIIF